MKVVFESSLTGYHEDIPDVLRICRSDFLSIRSGNRVDSYKVFTCNGRVFHYPCSSWIIFSVDGR